MKFLFDIIDITGIILEMYIIMVYFNMFLKKKSISIIKKFIFFSITFAFLFLGIKIPFLKPYIIFIAFFATFLFSFLYKTKLILRFVYSTIIFSMFIASEMIVGLILTVILSVDIDLTQKNPYYYLCGVVFSKFILLIIIKLLSIMKTTTDNSLRIKKAIPITILTISSAFIIYILSVTSYIYSNQVITFLTIIGVLMLLLSNIFIVYFIDVIIISENTKQRLIYAENQLNIQTDYYNQIIDNQIRIAKIYHDMNNAYISILGYFESNEYEQAKSKILSLNDEISKSKNTITCSNPCVGAILNVKNDKAIKENTALTIKLNIPPKINIDNIDLCIIIGNALDNAIEACQKIEDVNNRYIFFQICDKSEYISIYIENSIVTKTNLISEKKDILLHGYGTMNIKALCEKYNGNVVFDETEKHFKTYIILKNDII